MVLEGRTLSFGDTRIPSRVSSVAECLCTGSVPDHAVEPRRVVRGIENLVPGHRHRRSAQSRRAQNHRRFVVCCLLARTVRLLVVKIRITASIITSAKEVM